MTYVLAILFNIFTTLLYPSVFFILFITISLVGLLRKNRHFSASMLVLNLLLFYLTANGVLPSIALNALQKNLHPVNIQQIKQHRAMIVLGGGVTKQGNTRQPGLLGYARLVEAKRIYQLAQQQGIDYRIFLSGGNDEATIYQQTLINLGIPRHAFILDVHSQNTFENAKLLKPTLKQYPFKNYLLVTSGFHMRRAISYFKHAKINITPAPADLLIAHRHFWPCAENIVYQELAMHEIIGSWRLKVYDALGMN